MNPVIRKHTDNELTLQLVGNHDIDGFASFVTNSRYLIKSLSSSAVKGHRRPVNKLHWYPSSANVNGSITVTYTAETQNPESFEQFEDAFFRVGKSLMYGNTIDYSDSVEKYAKNLKKIVSGEDDSLVFMNQSEEAVIKSKDKPIDKKIATSSYGTVTGKIETITSRHGLRFVLYDNFFDRAVTCYVNDSEDQDFLANNFLKIVTVDGLVTRDPDTNRPFRITKVRGISVYKKPKYSWQDAQGVLQLSNELTPEEHVRKLRDA